MKKSVRDEGECYKAKFYGISSHLCCQMTPSLGYCPKSCIYCWRPHEFTLGKTIKSGKGLDLPEKILEGCFEGQKKLASGFGGFEGTNQKKLKESQTPKHFAISLSGEPFSYPNLNQFVKLLKQKNKSVFIVTNGMFPEKLKKIEPPTQLYLSLDSPNKELFKKITGCSFKDGWQRLIKSLKVMKSLKNKTRTALRLTLIKDVNMIEPENYAALIKLADPMFVEVKA